jgi:hypothetical protein
MWLPVDPTLNQFPADATHLRLTRGGLDKQAAVLPLLGRLRITVLDVELSPAANRVIVGRQAEPVDLSSVAVTVPTAKPSRCTCPENDE